MLDEDVLKQIWEQLTDALDSFANDNSLYEIRININTHEFLISTCIGTFDCKGNNVTLYPFRMYLHNAEIPYVQMGIDAVKLSEDNAVKLLASLRLGGY